MYVCASSPLLELVHFGTQSWGQSEFAWLMTASYKNSSNPAVTVGGIHAQHRLSSPPPTTHQPHSTPPTKGSLICTVLYRPFTCMHTRMHYLHPHTYACTPTCVRTPPPPPQRTRCEVQCLRRVKDRHRVIAQSF